MPRWTPQLARIAPLVLILFLVFTVNPARAQDTTTLPQGHVGKVYSVTIGIDTENGRGWFVWRLVHGDLPPGLQIVSTGKIEGTPTATKTDPYLFDLTVSDSSQPPQSAVLGFSLVIAAAPLRIKAVSVATTRLKGDLRFFFGVQLDVGCIMNKIIAGQNTTFTGCGADRGAAQAKNASP